MKFIKAIMLLLLITIIVAGCKRKNQPVDNNTTDTEVIVIDNITDNLSDNITDNITTDNDNNTDKNTNTNYTGKTVDELNVLLLKSIEVGDLSTVQTLVKHGADVNTEENRGRISKTALKVAIDNRHSQIIEYLIENGAYVYESILKNAISSACSTDTLNYLISKGAETKFLSFTEWAAVGSLDKVKEEVEAGVDIEYIGSRATTALAEASFNGHLTIVKYLITKGANIETFSESGTPLLLASDNGHLDIVKYLVEKGADKSVRNDYSGDTALDSAAGSGHLDVVKYLIDFKIEEESAFVTVETVLFWNASRGGHINVVEYLLKEKDVDINIASHPESDFGGFTGLMFASWNGHLGLAKFLVENGADVNIKDSMGRTALMIASNNGHLETVKILVENGADITIQDNEGKTALKHATYPGHLEIINYLNNAQSVKSDNKAVNSDSKTVLTIVDWANAGSLDDVVKGIKSGEDIDTQNDSEYTAISVASENGYLEIVEYLIKAGADVNIVNYSNTTPLMQASKNGHLSTVESLIKAGAELDIVDSTYKDTALILASGKGHTEIVKRLLKAGADIDKQGAFGEKTALMRALESGYVDTSKVLIDNGADVNSIENKAGQTALFMAKHYGYIPEIIAYMENSKK